MLRLFTVAYILLSFQVFALQVGKVQWGFNNQVKKQTFNFVSFEVINDSPRVYDSFIALEPQGMGVQTSIQKKLFLTLTVMRHFLL